MNLKTRVARLEAVAAPVEWPKILLVFVPPNDSARVANGIQRIHFGVQTWLRGPGEAEAEFKARVLAVLPPDDPTLTADYGESDE